MPQSPRKPDVVSTILTWIIIAIGTVSLLGGLLIQDKKLIIGGASMIVFGVAGKYAAKHIF